MPGARLHGGFGEDGLGFRVLGFRIACAVFALWCRLWESPKSPCLLFASPGQ